MVEIDTKHSTSKIRSLALRKYLETNVTQDDIAKTFHISKRTFRRWLQQYNEDNSVTRRNRTSVSYKIEEKHVRYAISILKKDQTISMKRLLEIVRKKYHTCSITSQHLGQVIRDNNITRKRTTIRHYPELRYGNVIDLKKELKIFYKKVNKFNIQDIICIDETAVYARMKKSYSRCDLGKRCVIKTKDNKVFVKYTILVAISNNKILGYKLYENGGINTQRLLDFLGIYINKYKKKLVIMDNAPAHRSSKIKELLNTKENNLQYSVPYHPKTNAIESWFNQFKHYLKLSYFVTFKELQLEVKKAIKCIKKGNYQNYFNYAYKSKKIRKVDTTKSSKYKTLKAYKK
jgi:transposase